MGWRLAFMLLLSLCIGIQPTAGAQRECNFIRIDAVNNPTWLSTFQEWGKAPNVAPNVEELVVKKLKVLGYTPKRSTLHNGSFKAVFEATKKEQDYVVKLSLNYRREKLEIDTATRHEYEVRVTQNK